MVCFKGDPHRQLTDSSWEHWCRELQQPLTLINFDYCDHCHDPSPKVQARIHEQQIAMLAGEWCDIHDRKVRTYFDKSKACPNCIAESQMYEMRS